MFRLLNPLYNIESNRKKVILSYIKYLLGMSSLISSKNAYIQTPTGLFFTLSLVRTKSALNYN